MLASGLKNKLRQWNVSRIEWPADAAVLRPSLGSTERLHRRVPAAVKRVSVASGDAWLYLFVIASDTRFGSFAIRAIAIATHSLHGATQFHRKEEAIMKSTDDTSVKHLLDRLPEKPDDSVGPTILTGRALSRSADTVHLAIAGGIVGVPIANIETVVPLKGSQHVPMNTVQIAVRNPQAIQSLLRVGAVLPGGVHPSGGGPTVEQKLPDGFVVDTDRNIWVNHVGVGTCTHHDTDTITGGQGEADQLDDYPPDECPADDTQE
jgi:hypothetical protein